jgi:hypothetical protein
MKKILYFAILFFVICYSCRKGTEKTIEISYEYFPLRAGLERVYKVTEINIDAAINKYDTSNYYLKEKICSEYIDNSGNKAWTLERYIKNDTIPSWEISDLWVAQIRNNQAQQVEENLRIVKIVFPPNKFEIWNGNAFNFLEPKYFEIKSINESIVLNGKNYTPVLTVIEEDDYSYIHKNYEVEQYAKEIGLINRTEISILDKSTVIDITKPIELRISVGRLYYQTLISNN